MEPEIPGIPPRREFTALYKLQILEEIEESPEEETAILSREGLTRSQIKYWRRQRARGELDDLSSAVTPYMRDHQALRGRSPSFMRLAFRDPPLRMAESAPLRQLFETIWRAKWTVISTVAILTTLTLIALAKITPVYSGQSLIMLESVQSAQGLDAETGLAGDPQTIETEMEVMRSRRLADRMIDQFKLAAIEEFNPALQPASLISRVSTFVNSFFGPLVSVSSEALSKTDRLAENPAVITNELLDHIQLSQKGKSRVISLEVQSKDPLLAAQLANGLAEGYISDQLGAKFRRIRRTNDWLGERIAVLRRKVAEAETEVENFRNSSDLADLLQGQSGDANTQEMSGLNAELVGARGRRSEAEARLREAKNSTETLDSPLIRTLKERATELDRGIAERAMEYGPAHPSMVNLEAQKEDLLDKIASEIRRNVAALENEVRVAYSREGDVIAQLKKLKSRLVNANQAEVQLRALEREAAAARELLESFLRRYQETSSYLDTQTPNARVISKADLPPEPSFPKPVPIIGLALFGSTFLGMMLALGKDLFKRGFNSSEHIERETELPVLSSVPKLGLLAKLRSKPEFYTVKYHNSAFGEAIRTLKTGVRLARKEQPRRRLLVTSALPREGKTVIATALAHSLSMGGRRTALIKADLRKPKVRNAHNDLELLGFGEYLAGTAELDEVIHKDKDSGFHVIPPGRLELGHLSELLDSTRMDGLLEELGDRYDFVIVDSPSIMAVSDPLILASKVNMILFVVRWATTRQDLVERGVQLLSGCEAPVGIVLSMVGKNQQTGFGQSYSHYNQTGMGSSLVRSFMRKEKA